jgi:hypothetical protein
MTWLLLGIIAVLATLFLIATTRLEEQKRHTEQLQNRNRKIRLDRHDDRVRWEQRLREGRTILEARHERTIEVMLENFITIQRRKNRMMAELVQYIAEQRKGRVTMSLSPDTVEFIKAIRNEMQQENTPNGR